MSLLINFKLSQSDLKYFGEVMLAARQKTESLPQQQIIDSAKQLLTKVNRSDATDFIREHMGQLETMINMLSDTGWGLIEDDRERVLAAMSYFSDPEDLIPDDVPGFGFLDDAIMIELAGKELEHEIQAYNEFVVFRTSETERRGDNAKTVQKSDWLEERRQQLHARMRRRRHGRGGSTKSKSPFSLF